MDYPGIMFLLPTFLCEYLNYWLRDTWHCIINTFYPSFIHSLHRRNVHVKTEEGVYFTEMVVMALSDSVATVPHIFMASDARYEMIYWYYWYYLVDTSFRCEYINIVVKNLKLNFFQAFEMISHDAMQFLTVPQNSERKMWLSKNFDIIIFTREPWLFKKNWTI